MITYTHRGGQARRAFDAATLAGVPLRRRAPLRLLPDPPACRRCQGSGEVPTWSPDGGIFGEFTGMVPCSCPAAAAQLEVEDAAAIAAAGGEPELVGHEDWMAF